MTSPLDHRRYCPYVGLQPFEEADQQFFFGRERDQRIIISNLLSSPLTILYGASGVGKSSVLMAGVIPQLHRERPKTPVVIFRNWADADFQSVLKRACIDAVWNLAVDQPKPAESLPFDEILRACAEAAHETMVVILDQFEEYFLYHPKSTDPVSFEAQFARAVNRDDVDAGFLIAMRDDGLAKLDRFQERIPNLLSNRLILKHLDAAGAKMAIRQPLVVWNEMFTAGGPLMEIEEELIDELIEQVQISEIGTNDQGGSGASPSALGRIEAPFLQLVLVRLWVEEVGAGSNILRRATMDRLKGAKEVVRTHLDEVMSRLEAVSQAVCASFFDRLVTPSGSKVACSAADLARWAGADLAPRVPAVLDGLSRERILRTVAAALDKPEDTRYEIYHDVLAPAILDWQRRYKEAESRALAVKQAREQASRRALRQWLFALATMTVIAITGWIFATWEELRSKANQKAAESLYTASFDARSGLNLALEAVEMTAFFGLPSTAAESFTWQPTPTAENALRQVIQAWRLEWTLPTDSVLFDIAFSPDGQELAIAGKDHVRVWDISTGTPQPKQVVLPHKAWVRNLAFLPRKDRLLTAANMTAYLWSLDEPPTPLCSFIQGSPIYRAFAVSRDGSLLATAGDGNRKKRYIKVWDLTTCTPTAEPIATIDVAGAWVMGLAFSPDGSGLATACVERSDAGTTSTAAVWSVKTGREIMRLPIEVASDAVVFMPDGKSLVTGSRDGWIRIWQPAVDDLAQCMAQRSGLADPKKRSHAATPEAIPWSEHILAGHGDSVRDIAISPDGRRIASASADQTAKIWDIETGENVLTLTGHEGPVEAVKFSPDGQHVATASRDKTVKLWNIEGHTATVTSVAFSPDGKTLATGSSDRTAKLWDLSKGTPRLRYTLRGHTDQIYRIAFNPAGTVLATASFDNTVKLWSADSGLEIITLSDHKDQLRGVAFSGDSTYLASAGADGATWLYHLKGQEVVKTAFSAPHNSEHPTIQASALAFHPEKGLWATGGWDGRLQLWDVFGKNAGTIILMNKEEDSPRRISDIAFSPDGKIIAALARRWVYFWPMEAFTHPHSKPAALLTMEDVGYCNALTYSRDGQQLAVACNDATVRIFNTAENTLIKTVNVHKNAVMDVAFNQDGTRLATASKDKSFQVSPVHFADLYDQAKRMQKAAADSKPQIP